MSFSFRTPARWIAHFMGSIVWFFISLSSALGQVEDHFSDGDFSQQPRWSGKESFFTVANEHLKLQAPPQNGTAYLATESEAIDEAEWSWKAHMDFNPSSSNYAWVYLAATSSDLTSKLQGFFVMMGGDEDDVSLYEQNGEAVVKVIDGRNGVLNLPSFTLAVRVTRDAAGNWQLFTDVGPTGNWTLEGTGLSQKTVSAQYFGLVCHYTSTRANLFWFDDFFATGKPPIKSPPAIITAVTASSDASVLVSFDRAPTAEKAQLDPSHYLLSPGKQRPQLVTAANELQAFLLFTPPLTDGIQYTLYFHETEALEQAARATTQRSWTQQAPTKPKARDIIINEIMADPSPPVGLAETEFIEIYNRSNHDIELGGWLLADASTTVRLPQTILPPNQYHVIAPSEAILNIPPSRVTKIGYFPALNNDEESIVLKDASGHTIDSLHYTPAWYHSTLKQEGGWTLEQIDQNRKCSDADNWRASENPQGGSPGEPNSVQGNRPDIVGPSLLNIFTTTNDEVTLVFNEALAKSNLASFTFDPALNTIDYSLVEPERTTLHLRLVRPLAPDISYRVAIKGIADCEGNPLQKENSTAPFGLARQPNAGELIINELLFNPRTNGVDFIELYNPTPSYLDLQNSLLTSYSGGKSHVERMEKAQIMAPNTYLVLVTEPVTLADQYPQGEHSTFVQQRTPPLADDEGILVWTRSDSQAIDSVYYSSTFHDPLLSDVAGVSLERIVWKEPALTANNWRSAAALAGFATPGKPNTNARTIGSSSDHLWVSPAAFSPQSTQANFTLISFHLDRTDWIGTVRILDHTGRVMKTLANNATLGTEGFFRWEGERDDQSQPRTGYYSVVFELFNGKGEKQTLRERIVVMGL